MRGLIDFDDISYDDHADLLYDLSGQMIKHLLSYLSEEDARNVLIYHQKQLIAFMHAQVQGAPLGEGNRVRRSCKQGFHGAEAECFYYGRN